MNMDQAAKAKAFKALHVKGTPLVLYNIWDAGSAKAVAQAGAAAVATGSWAVSAAQGFGDGENMPLPDVLRTAGQIARAVSVPVSVDFEGGYATDPAVVATNAGKLLDTGVIGINYEDRIVKGKGLHSIAGQAERIAAMREMADARGITLFINARTDVFFQGLECDVAFLMDEALARARAYAEAGADGLFVPGLAQVDLIARFCDEQELPVNVMRQSQDIAQLANLGVARISHGGGSYLAAMEGITQAAAGLA